LALCCHNFNDQLIKCNLKLKIMKKTLFFSMVLAFIFASCNQQNLKSPVEGAWKLVGFTTVSGDTVRNLTSAVTGDQIKMWTTNHFSFTGKWKADNTDLFGCGTYTLIGNNYTENIAFHNDKSLINTVFKAKLEIRNDTLYQTFHPTDATGKEMESYSSTEKYIKL
jgi:hypothetical protein